VKRFQRFKGGAADEILGCAARPQAGICNAFGVSEEYDFHVLGCAWRPQAGIYNAFGVSEEYDFLA